MPTFIQQNVINALRSLGAIIHLDEKNEAVRLDWGLLAPVLDGGLVLMLELDTLLWVTLSSMNDKRLGYVSQVPKLKGFEIFDHHGVRQSRVSDAGLEHFRNLTQLEQLSLYSHAFTDAGLEHLKECSLLTKLEVGSNLFTDVGVGHLCGLANLEYLAITGEKITLTGLSDLGCKDNLKEFYGSKHLRLDYVELFPSLEKIVHSDASDPDLTQLKKPKHLKYLAIGESPQVTDAGVEHLVGLTSLEEMYLFETSVTREGRKRLQDALPFCRIEYDTDLARSQLRATKRLSDEVVS